MTEPSIRRVAVVGFGAIGRAVALRLRDGVLPGVELVGVVEQKLLVDSPGVERITLAEAVERADIVVECAGQGFVRQQAVELLRSGHDLVLCSVGALADQELRAAIEAAGPGRVARPTGAVGGLDLLESAGRYEGFDTVRLTTTKLPRSLVQDWMDEATRERILTADGPVEVFRGSVVEACAAFPSSINVSAAVALAIDDFDLVDVVLVADPAASLTRHRVEASGSFGTYTFTFDNLPSPENPRTSAVVASSVLHAINGLVPRPVEVSR